jgi:hypothetical protein
MHSERGNTYDVWHPKPLHTRRAREVVDKRQTRIPETLEPAGEECEFCGTEMFSLHCKLVCPNCGYRRDCSDP